MPKATVLLVRHGQTDANLAFIVQGQRDYQLNLTGKKQAEDVAEKLRDFPIDAIYTSPLSRAFDTAKEIRRLHGEDVPLIVLPGLNEMRAGEYEGQTFSSKEEVYKYGILKAVERGGESVEAFQKRVHEAIREIVEKNDGRTVVVVSHGGTTMALLNALRGNPPEEMINIEPPGNTEILRLELRN